MLANFTIKKQSLQQAIIQSDCIDDLRKEVTNVELNLGIKLQNGDKIFKDDRETKLRMIRALINFDSFKIEEGRVIQNEFDSSNQVNYSSHILKVHWYPTAEELIRRYVIENKDIPLCNLSTISTPDLVLTKEGASLLQKTKQNKSIVINIKAIQSSISNTAERKTAKLKQKCKEAIASIQWLESPFEKAAAFCNHDGTKSATGKAKFKSVLIDKFSNIKTCKMNPDDTLQATTFEDTEKESTTTIKESVILGDDATEHLSDAQLANCPHTLSIESSKCQIYTRCH